jgi:hypothetical protein
MMSSDIDSELLSPFALSLRCERKKAKVFLASDNHNNVELNFVFESEKRLRLLCFRYNFFLDLCLSFRSNTSSSYHVASSE